MAQYRSSDYPPFAVTVDLVVLTVHGDRLDVLTVRRGEAPFKGQLALPGGFVRPTEDLDAAAQRELFEETGLALDTAHLEQLASYGALDRDPRMRVVSVAYLALTPNPDEPHGGGDAAAAQWTPVTELAEHPRRLAFDHAAILADGVERARAKLEYTPLATAFVGDLFTIADLRHVYDVVWGTTLDPRNFHRKATGTPGFVAPQPGAFSSGPGRPAQLFRAGPASTLYPPILRS